MKRLMLVALVGIFAMTLASVVRAEGVPWKGGNGPAPAPGAAAPETPAAPVTPGDLKSELSPVQYKSLIKPIEDAQTQAEKMLELVKKEMEKPADKQNLGMIVGLKDRAIGFYISAANSAKSAIGRLPKDKESAKAAIAEQFEKPNKQKAIDMLMELAALAAEKKDFRYAAALYKRLLALDPDNAAAKEAMKKLDADYKEFMKNPPKTGPKGGGSDAKDRADRYWDNPTGVPRGGWGGDNW